MPELNKENEDLLIHLLKKMGLITDKFFGKLGINLQSGNIISYDKKETIKR